jgi:hypothetical protein
MRAFTSMALWTSCAGRGARPWTIWVRFGSPYIRHLPCRSALLESPPQSVSHLPGLPLNYPVPNAGEPSRVVIPIFSGGRHPHLPHIRSAVADAFGAGPNIVDGYALARY